MAGPQCQGAVPPLQPVLFRPRQLRDHLVDHVVVVQADHTEPPAGGTVVLGVRVDQQRVAGQIGGQRAEALHEGAVDVVGDDHQPRVRGPHDVLDLLPDPVAQGQRRRIGGIDQADQPDGRVRQLGDLLVRVAPLAHPRLGEHVGLHIGDVEAVGVELGDLDVRGEDRHHERDPVPLVQQAVLHEGVEDVAHGGRAALGREQAQPVPRGRLPAEEFVGEVAADDLLGVREHAVGHRVVVGDGRVGQFVDEGVLVEAEALQRVRHTGGEEFDAGHARVLPDERVEAVPGTLPLRHPAEVVGRPDPLGLREGEVAEGVEGLARSGRHPVGVAAARVEHLRLRLALLAGLVELGVLGQADEDVLQLERGEPGVRLDLLGGQAHLGQGFLLGVRAGCAGGVRPSGQAPRTPTRSGPVSGSRKFDRV